jgi:hypothetical protein
MPGVLDKVNYIRESVRNVLTLTLNLFYSVDIRKAFLQGVRGGPVTAQCV